MNLLLLGTGGGGGNIVRSVKALFHRDLAVTQQADRAYAERLQAAVTTCCLDTNEFALADLPAEERLLIGPGTTGRLGARHNPEVAKEALAESTGEVETLLSRHSAVVLVGTGGKGTGAGTMFPLAQLARRMKKLVIPIFVRPSFERHEIDKRRYDHALAVSQQFDAERIRLVEVLNDRGYSDADPQPQARVWERMNLPIARGLRGLIYVLWDLSQVDPSDLSMLLAGPGRLRIGFGEINPPAGEDPAEEQVEQAVRDCWQNPYCSFAKPTGTSLICIQGEWSNVVDARIKGRLATLAMGGAADSPYTPLSARSVQSPRPWGVTALFAEYTGPHAPVEIDWPFDRPSEYRIPAIAAAAFVAPGIDRESPSTPAVSRPASDAVVPPLGEPQLPFATLWEFAVAVNRFDPSALAVAKDGTTSRIHVDGREVRKLLSTMWFRSVLPQLSPEWRMRLLEALVQSVTLRNHAVKAGRRTQHLKDLSYAELVEVGRTSVPDGVRTDLELLTIVGRLWGEEAIGRFTFADDPHREARSRFVDVLHGLRNS